MGFIEFFLGNSWENSIDTAQLCQFLDLPIQYDGTSLHYDHDDQNKQTKSNQPDPPPPPAVPGELASVPHRRSLDLLLAC